MKKVIISVMVVVLAVILYWVFLTSKPTPVAVQTVPVLRGSIINSVTATGTVEPITQVEVGSQVSGVIKKIYVDYNSQVKANQLLAELDKSTLIASLREARANLKAALNDRDYQQKNFDRVSKLYESKVVSSTDYEEALYDYNSAKISAELSQSDVDKAETNLSYASIYSPIDGVVLSRDVDEGQTVAASYETPEFFTIAQDLKQMQVEADVDEADIGQVKVGQRVSFTVDAYPDGVFSGEVTQVRLEATEDSNVITYTVIIKAPNEDLRLMPGLTASITIYTEEIENVLILEAKAFNFKLDSQLVALYQRQFDEPVKIKDENMESKTEEVKKVWVKTGNDLTARLVTIGSSDGVNVQLVSGLEEKDQVVYAMEEQQEKVESAQAESSPFMPKPPGKK